MPRVCTICAHPEHHQINVALVAREPYRAIAVRFGVSKGALQRHSREHIPELLVKASRAVEAADADDLLEQVRGLFAEAQGVLEAAKEERDHRVVLAAIDRASRQLELLAKLRGELDESPQVNIIISPVVQQAIIGALQPFPEARMAMVNALYELKQEQEALR